MSRPATRSVTVEKAVGMVPDRVVRRALAQGFAFHVTATRRVLVTV